MSFFGWKSISASKREGSSSTRRYVGLWIPFWIVFKFFFSKKIWSKIFIVFRSFLPTSWLCSTSYIEKKQRQDQNQYRRRQRRRRRDDSRDNDTLCNDIKAQRRWAWQHIKWLCWVSPLGPLCRTSLRRMSSSPNDAAPRPTLTSWRIIKIRL